MKRVYFFLLLILLAGCNENQDFDYEPTRFLTLNDIKHEYYIADSINNLEDRSNIDTTTSILGVDKRNGQTIIRTFESRGFGCLLFADYCTIKYLNCDSVCCKYNGGNWLVDYVGIVGSRSVVGCVPDTFPSSKFNSN